MENVDMSEMNNECKELSSVNGSAIRDLKQRIRNARNLYTQSSTHSWGDFAHKEEADRLQRELSKLQQQNK